MINSRAMRTSDFDFHLPEELIAQYPLEQRTASRLLHVSGEQLHWGMDSTARTFPGGYGVWAQGMVGMIRGIEAAGADDRLSRRGCNRGQDG